MASNVPVLAWDQGLWLDPGPVEWEPGPVAASSVPYFSPECGERFADANELRSALDRFLGRLSAYQPRRYVAEHLTLEASARAWLAAAVEAGFSAAAQPPPTNTVQVPRDHRESTAPDLSERPEVAYLGLLGDDAGGDHVSMMEQPDRTREPEGAGPRRAPQPRLAADEAIDHGSADLFDWPAIRAWTAFVWGAPRRHKRLAGGVFVTCLALAAMAVAWLPRTYRTEARILASRNVILPLVGNPGRAIPMDADAPTRGAAETILRRESLVALVKQTNLVERWQLARPLVLQLKDQLWARLAGPLDEETRVDALVYMLEQRLRVTTDDGIITIEVDWQDAQTAYLLVNSAQQNFLETRHALEVSTIAEAISILEGHAAELHARVEADSLALRAAREGRNAEAGAVQAPSPVGGAVAAGRKARQPRESAELADLRLILAAKRRAVADLESFRQRRVGELQAQLSELKANYTAAHPQIQAIKESMESLTRDSPQLAQLRREEKELVAQLMTAAGANALEDPSALAAPTPAPVLVREYRARPARQGDDDTAETMRMRVNLAIQKYEGLLDRIESARIELDTARAAFKYRYTVVRPAEVSKKPAKPNITLVLLSGPLLGLILAFGATSWLDRGAWPRAARPLARAAPGGKRAGS